MHKAMKATLLCPVFYNCINRNLRDDKRVVHQCFVDRSAVIDDNARGSKPCHKKWIVTLTSDERKQLLNILKRGNAAHTSIRRFNRAHVLLMANGGKPDA
jgi:hypothetical protein